MTSFFTGPSVGLGEPVRSASAGARGTTGLVAVEPGHVARISDVVASDDVGGADARLIGLAVRRRLLALPFGLDPAQVVVDLVVAALVVPAECTGHELRSRGGGGDTPVEGLDGDAGPAGEHVVEVPGALVRDGVDDLGPQVVLPTGGRLPEVGSLRDEREELVDQAAVPAEEVVDARDVQPGRLGQLLALVGARLEPVGSGQPHPLG